MTDPQQTTAIPTNNQQATPNQETDFFGGGEDAFHNWAVINPNETPTPFVPEEPVWEPTVPEAPAAPVMETSEPVLEPIPDEEAVIPEPEASFEPMPEIEEPAPEIEETTPETAEQKEETVEPVVETIPEPVVETIPEATVQEHEPEAITTDTSDLGKKFMELSQLCRQIQDWKKTDEWFQLVWADNDKLQILYKFVLGDPEFPMVSVSKIEKDKTDDEETTHELNFYLNEAGTSLNINLDEELLFEEEVDLQDDVKKRMQVMDKLNKFIFLVTEESKKIEKEMKAQEAEQEEKRKLQDIFRNF
jgi:hypothetical protein